MTRLTWDDRQNYGGCDRGVIYFHNSDVQVWNGITAVTEKPSDLRTRVRYRDGQKSLNKRAEDSFAATVECFTYPDAVLGPRTVFDMSYRVNTAKGYEIHLVYNAIARVTGGAYKQENEVTPFTIDITTKPRAMPLLRLPSAHLVIEASKAFPGAVAEVESTLYGGDETEPRFPTPEELVPIFDLNAYFTVIDNGDGTATITAPDEIFEWLSETQAIADWPYVNPVDEDTVRIRSF